LEREETEEILYFEEGKNSIKNSRRSLSERTNKKSSSSQNKNVRDRKKCLAFESKE
jgi:hypothetical protein